VQWDPVWSRWVVTADAFAESSTVQYFFIAVSKTSSATGAWFVYSTNTNSFTGTGAFWDFPSIGMDQDGLIFTANVFGPSSFLGSYTFALSKALAYNGHPQGFAIFGGLAATLQPPVLHSTDANGYAFLAAAPGGSGTISLYAMRDSSRPNVTTLFGPYSVSGVPAFAIPPSVVQPSPCGGGSNAIDSGDNRFNNASTQDGDKLYQVHTVALGGFSAPRYYIISGLSSFSPTVAETGTFFATGTSYDFNASIGEDNSGEMVMTWSVTDPALSTNAQVKFVGKQAGDPIISGTGGGQGVLLTSGACITGNFDSRFGLQRWGDYSQVTPDPSTLTTARKFWMVNETIVNSSTWGSEFGSVHF
jgi:hypothetical protein